MKLNKKGSIEQEFFSKGVELLIPFIAFVIVLGVIWTIGTSRSAQLLFESTEVANIIDTAATFDGDLRVKFDTTLKDLSDFAFKISATRVETSVRNSDIGPVTRQVHVPSTISLYSSLNHPATKQLQMQKADSTIKIKDWNENGLDFSLFGLGEKSCQKEKLSGKIYFDTDNSAFYSLLSQQGLLISSQPTDAALTVLVSVHKSRLSTQSSLIIFADSSEISSNFACHIANQFAAKTFDSVKVNAVNVPAVYNPYVPVQPCVASQTKTCTPNVIIDITLDGSFTTNPYPVFIPDQGISTYVALKIKAALKEVSS